jgi:hypothetical protein
VSTQQFRVTNFKPDTLSRIEQAVSIVAEYDGQKLTARQDIINDALYRAERTNAILSERIRLVGKTPSPSRSKP